MRKPLAVYDFERIFVEVMRDTRGSIPPSFKSKVGSETLLLSGTVGWVYPKQLQMTNGQISFYPLSWECHPERRLASQNSVNVDYRVLRVLPEGAD